MTIAISPQARGVRFFILAVSCLCAFTTACVAQEPISEGEKSRVISTAAALITKKYAVAETGQQIAQQLTAHFGSGAFDDAQTASALATALTVYLKPFDVHFTVDWSSSVDTTETTGAVVEAPATGADNYGFDAFTLLSGNIAYLKLSKFALVELTDPEDLALQKAKAMMTMMRDANAVVFDLRECAGGSPEMVQLLVSYFFDDEPRLIDRLYWRPDGNTYEFWTLPELSVDQHPDMPISIITSGRTASACEAFAYDIKSLSRGVLIGTRTLGAANPGETLSLGGGYTIFIPSGLVENAITQNNWGGDGVTPDIEASYDHAVRTAHQSTLNTLLADEQPGSYEHTVWTWTNERYDAQDNPITLDDGWQRLISGSYGKRTITVAPEGLFYSRSKREPLRHLIPLGQNRFAIEGFDDTRVEFNRDQNTSVVMTIRSASGATSSYKKTAGAKQ